MRLGDVEAGIGRHEIADEQTVAGRGFADRGRGSAHAGQVLQGVVDLAEFDAPSADLHLVVGAAHEQQAGGVQAHEITTAIGAFPAERGHRCVLLRVLRGIEVARQADAADNQFADLAFGHRLALGIDDREIPTAQRQSDTDRAVAAQRGGARHDRRLGGAVGVPHLAAGDGEPVGELGRAGLAAEDQQPHGFQRLRRPQGRQRGNRRHDRDVARHQPRTEVHAAADQRARCGHQARAVAPRQPHLLARGVERDRQSGQDTVVRADRGVRQEHGRLGVDERRRVAVGDRDALRLAGGTGGEDDPRVVVGCGAGRRLRGRRRRFRRTGSVGVDDGVDLGLAEDEFGTFVRVVGVDRHVRGAGIEGRQDRDVQVPRPRRHPDADPASPPDADLAETCDRAADHGQQLAVGEGHLAVVDGRGIRVCTRGGGEHVAEGARRVCLCRQEELRWNGHLNGTCRAHPRSGHESENIADEGDRTTSTP